ncbi:hypothetical protein [Gluconobacter oxydans]|uniref:hypothetical protein n=1 Tax=Gluconobacter oxydans TaxID=442 RepID=UPI0012DA8AC8|nr:hypothetical protein [Gluconobacter oxydans]
MKAIYFSQGLYWRKGKYHGKSGVGVFPWCWVDLDVYNSIADWDEMTWEERTATLTEGVMSSGLPFPTLMITSGRGAYMIWKLSDPVWNVSKGGGKRPISVVEAVNKALAKRLSDLGADMKCTEGARVLRVPGSRHSGTGELVKILHNSGLTYAMSDLKAAVLPHSSAQVSEWKKARDAKTRALNKQRKAWAAENAAYAEKKQRANDPCNIISLDNARARRGGFSRRTHALKIIEDLRTLAGIRWPDSGEAQKGFRDLFGHLAVSALAGCTKPNELLEVARGHLSGLVPHRYLMSKKFEADNAPSVRLAREEKRYAYSGKRMAELLNVTPEEEKALSVIVGAEVKKTREVIRSRENRRKAGAVERSEYEAGSLSNAKPWEAEGISRASWYRRQKTGAEVITLRA